MYFNKWFIIIKIDRQLLADVVLILIGLPFYLELCAILPRFRCDELVMQGFESIMLGLGYFVGKYEYQISYVLSRYLISLDFPLAE